MKKRILAMLMTLSMIAAMVPTVALAAEVETITGLSIADDAGLTLSWDAPSAYQNGYYYSVGMDLTGSPTIDGVQTTGNYNWVSENTTSYSLLDVIKWNDGTGNYTNVSVSMYDVDDYDEGTLLAEGDMNITINMTYVEDTTIKSTISYSSTESYYTAYAFDTDLDLTHATFNCSTEWGYYTSTLSDGNLYEEDGTYYFKEYSSDSYVESAEILYLDIPTVTSSNATTNEYDVILTRYEVEFVEVGDVATSEDATAPSGLTLINGRENIDISWDAYADTAYTDVYVTTYDTNGAEIKSSQWTVSTGGTSVPVYRADNNLTNTTDFTIGKVELYFGIPDTDTVTETATLDVNIPVTFTTVDGVIGTSNVGDENAYVAFDLTGYDENNKWLHSTSENRIYFVYLESLYGRDDDGDGAMTTTLTSSTYLDLATANLDDYKLVVYNQSDLSALNILIFALDDETALPDEAEVEEETVLPEETVDASGFTDVVADAYYYEPMLWAVENGITTGVTDTTFEPTTTCSRAASVTFLYRLASQPEVDVENALSDVAAGSWYEDAVLWAVENGITNGTGDGFSPNAICTRAEIVTFLYRYAGEPEVEGTSTFADVADNAWYANAVIWAAENGITTGTGDGFAPNAPCTRGEIVTFVYRYMVD